MRVFTADEIFQIAMEMEETGQVFYEVLAAGAANDRVAGLCRRLSEAEKRHYLAFEQMRKDLAVRPADRPLTWEETVFAQEMLNEAVVPNPRKAREVAAAGSLLQVLDLAIKMERDSIAFYGHLIPLVAEAEAKAVQEIIKEEEKHEKELLDAKKSLHK